MISEMVSPKTSHHLLLLQREDGCGARRQPQPGSSGNTLLKLKVCLPGGAFGSFQSNNEEFRSYFPYFGMQRSKFHLMLAICFNFCWKRSLQGEAILMTFTANS